MSCIIYKNYLCNYPILVFLNLRIYRVVRPFGRPSSSSPVISTIIVFLNKLSSAPYFSSDIYNGSPSPKRTSCLFCTSRWTQAPYANASYKSIFLWIRYIWYLKPLCSLHPAPTCCRIPYPMNMQSPNSLTSSNLITCSRFVKCCECRWRLLPMSWRKVVSRSWWHFCFGAAWLV